MAHETTTDVRPNGVLEYRWRCSCKRAGDWSTSALTARRGGERHVAAMERATTKRPSAAKGRP